MAQHGGAGLYRASVVVEVRDAQVSARCPAGRPASRQAVELRGVVLQHDQVDITLRMRMVRAGYVLHACRPHRLKIRADHRPALKTRP